jgi:predicted flap endonuclease-1-like 5' DNA nuclease
VYLVAQIGWLLLIAFLLGALIGYAVWRACGVPWLKSESTAQRRALEDRVAALEWENVVLERAATSAEAAVGKLEAERAVSAAEIEPRNLSAMPATSVVAPAESATRLQPLPEASAAFLAAPRDGKPDNLKLIRGIGPRLEKILNAMGVYHFDQIASWTESDLATVDSRLGDFAGRALRDKWIEQSRKFAERARSIEAAGNVTP